MRKLFSIFLLCPTSFLFSQLPEDALRYGYPVQSGTARNQAIAGAGASLGGDITSAYINPAGIGLYKNRELVLSPGYNFINNKFDYRGEQTKATDNAFNYGTTGLVFGRVNRYNPQKSFAFAIAVNQLANYNNRTEYAGLNGNSSWSEQYAEELVSDRASINAAENNYIFGSSLAYYTFLVDSFTNSQGQQGYFTQTDDLLASGGSLVQQNTIDTRGGAHEISFAFANNLYNRLHLGGSFNVPVYSFTKDQTYREEDASGNSLNNFDFFEYRERYTSSGVGVNVKVGLIARPMERLRIGVALHTPTFGTFVDKINSSITADTENYTGRPQPITTTSDELKGNTVAGRYEYELMTPFRMIASGSWVINEVGDVKQQRGFLTADLEYVNYGGTRYTANSNGTQDDVNYYDRLNEIIKDRYKGALNLKLGGEVKFNTVMARGGFAFMGSPYRDKQLQGRRILASAGLGYRNRGFFVDLAYIHAFIKDNHVPYYLEQKANPIADANNNRGNAVLTLGFKI